MWSDEVGVEKTKAILRSKWFCDQQNNESLQGAELERNIMGAVAVKA